MAETLDWTMPRAEDRARWWVRDQLYTLVPRTPLSDSVMTVQWDEAVLCVADVLKFPDSRGFNARTLNGYTYLSPMTITDPAVIEQRLGQFFGNVEALAASVEQDLAAYAAEQDADEAYWQAKDFAAETNPMLLLEHWRRSLVSLDRAWKMHFLIVFPRHVVAGMVEHGAHDWAGITAAHEIGKLTRTAHFLYRQRMSAAAVRAMLRGPKDSAERLLVDEFLDATVKQKAENYARMLSALQASAIAPSRSARSQPRWWRHLGSRLASRHTTLSCSLTCTTSCRSPSCGSGRGGSCPVLAGASARCRLAGCWPCPRSFSSAPSTAG